LQCLEAEKYVRNSQPPPFSRSALGNPAVPANTKYAAQLSDFAKDNTSEDRWLNAAGTDVVRGNSVLDTDQFALSEEVYTPMRKTIQFVVGPRELDHAALLHREPRLPDRQDHGNPQDGGIDCLDVNRYVEKITGTTVPGSGTTVMSGTFNLKATAATVQTATLSTTNTGDSDNPDLLLASGDRLGVVFSGAATELAGVVIEVSLAPAGTSLAIVYNLAANGDLVDQHFFVANRDYRVMAIRQVHSTLGTNGSAVTLDVKKSTSTQAAASGTTMLSATFDMKASINTVRLGTLTSTEADLRLAPGDRISIDYTGTLTALAGVVVVVTLQAVERRKEVTFTLQKNANLADQAFFIADRNYEILAISEIHDTAGTDGGAVSLQVTRDKLTDAPGAGTDLLSNNASARVQPQRHGQTVQSWDLRRYPIQLPDARRSTSTHTRRCDDRLANSAVTLEGLEQSSPSLTATASSRPPASAASDRRTRPFAEH
jgi:hypothetical protein